jgi:hypothetical protein
MDKKHPATPTTLCNAITRFSASHHACSCFQDDAQSAKLCFRRDIMLHASLTRQPCNCKPLPSILLRSASFGVVLGFSASH